MIINTDIKWRIVIAICIVYKHSFQDKLIVIPYHPEIFYRCGWSLQQQHVGPIENIDDGNGKTTYKSFHSNKIRHRYGPTKLVCRSCQFRIYIFIADFVLCKNPSFVPTGNDSDFADVAFPSNKLSLVYHLDVEKDRICDTYVPRSTSPEKKQMVVSQMRAVFSLPSGTFCFSVQVSEGLGHWSL